MQFQFAKMNEMESLTCQSWKSKETQFACQMQFRFSKMNEMQSLVW